MLLIPLHTPLIRPGDALDDLLYRGEEIRDGDILVVSSKAVAMSEGTLIDLSMIQPSPTAVTLSEKTERSPAFCEAMLQELTRLRGKVVGTCPGAALTEVRPEGLATGTILIANAGLDESNAARNHAIGWPKDPVASIRMLRKELEERVKSEQWKVESTSESASHSPLSTIHSRRVAVILTDSCCMPRRQGVTAFALAVSGLDPLESMKGQSDLFGKSLKITTEALADQLATAANFVMGNAAQSIPAVLIREHGISLSEYEGWVPGIDAREDLFKSLL